MFSFWNRYFSKDREYFKLIWRILRIVPSNIELYKLALVHRSSSIENESHLLNNERLEFLGDAVLQTIVSELVFLSDRNATEGELTRNRSRIVSRVNLNALGKHMNLGDVIIARPHSLVHSDANILGNAFEALVGAMYLDIGYTKTSDVVIRLLQKKLDIWQVINTEKDFKSRIIEWAQKEHLEYEFKTEKNDGYSESSPSFKTILLVNSVQRGLGIARNKKTSEQKAAKELYQELIKSGSLVTEEE